MNSCPKISSLLEGFMPKIPIAKGCCNNSTHEVLGFLGKPWALLISRSPSANHLLALTIWITLIICFPAITGQETPAMTHGQKLSILFARASSRAPALYGDAKRVAGEGLDGLPGWRVDAVSEGLRREGESIGELKDRR